MQITIDKVPLFRTLTNDRFPLLVMSFDTCSKEQYPYNLVIATFSVVTSTLYVMRSLTSSRISVLRKKGTLLSNRGLILRLLRDYYLARILILTIRNNES